MGIKKVDTLLCAHLAHRGKNLNGCNICPLSRHLSLQLEGEPGLINRGGVGPQYDWGKVTVWASVRMTSNWMWLYLTKIAHLLMAIISLLYEETLALTGQICYFKTMPPFLTQPNGFGMKIKWLQQYNLQRHKQDNAFIQLQSNLVMNIANNNSPEEIKWNEIICIPLQFPQFWTNSLMSSQGTTPTINTIGNQWMIFKTFPEFGGNAIQYQSNSTSWKLQI